MWFRVDDSVPDNKKTRRVRRSHPTKRRDLAPFGLWVMAGAWSDDGWVPLEWLEDHDDDAEVLAARLVDAGLWHPEDRDGERGYAFNDWHEYNPATGAKDAGSWGAHIRHHVNKKVVNPDCEHCPSEPPMDPPEVSEVSPPSSPPNANRWHTRPDPTRPEPDQPVVTEVGRESAAKTKAPSRATRRPDDFRPSQAHVDLAAERGVDLRTEWANFCDWTDANGKTYKDWPAALRTWIRRSRPAPGVASRPSRVQENLALAHKLAAEEGTPRLEGLA